MMLLRNYNYALRAAAATLLWLAGCGSGSQPGNSGNFSGTVDKQSESAGGTPTATPGVASVTLSPGNIAGGSPALITVNLTQPAPAGGLDVHLQSSDATVVATPQTVRIPPGQTSATVAAPTSAVADSTTVAVSATSGDTVAGTSLQVNAPTASAEFSIAGHPATVAVAAGQSGSTTVKTRVASGYSHALQLSVTRTPAGVSVTLTPSAISAPGAGSSTAEITVPAGLASGTYPIRLTASDGTISRNTTVRIQVGSSGSGSSGPGATFQGCLYQRNGHRYQGVRISVANPGTYPFDAYLYRGPSCQANQQIDEFGFGTPLNFGGWLFWFSDFGDQTDTSAIWFVGSDKSQCVNYAVAPPC
ncbi:MAG: hypothetical protein ACRD2U_14045 [Terriglobales bacterium]